ncbi:MAG: GAF domain-containing protein, partial [Myxococcota bacterium]
ARGPQAHKVLGERIPSGLGIVGFTVQRGVSLLIHEPRNDPRFFANMDRRTGYQTVSVLAVPVSFDGTTFGCLELLNAPKKFTGEHLERLSQVADRLAEQLLVVV